MLPRLWKRAKTFVVLAATLFPVVARASELPISGRVLGPDQAPIRGAVVEVLPRLGTWERLQHRLDGTKPDIADRTFTGDDGAFELPPQPTGLWILRVRAEGMLDASRHLPPAWIGGLLEDLTMLRSDEVLSLRVVDDGGRPIEGAEVDVSLDWGGNRWHLEEVYARLVTDARGQVHLPCPGQPAPESRTRVLRPKNRIRTVARLNSGPNHWRTSAVVTAEGPGLLTLRLARRENGKPATVRFVRQGRPLADVAVLDPLGPVAIADAEGRVELPLASPQLGRAWHRSLRIVTRDRVLEWPTTMAEDLEIEVPAPGSWTGQVVSEDGFPVADAAVFVAAETEEPVLALTDRQGVYTLSGPLPRFSLEVRARGYVPTHLRLGRENPHPATSRELPTAVLVPAARVVARVVDTAGGPLQDVRAEVLVHQTPSDGVTTNDARLARSDADGHLVFHGLTPGAVVLSLLRKEGYALREVGFSVPAEAAPPLSWVMEPGVEVAGRTVDEDGEPVAGAEVELKPQATEDVPKEVRYARGLGEIHRATSDADGSFAFGSVAGGPFRLRAEAEGLLGAARLVEVASPGPMDLGDLELTAGLTLEGRVVDDQTGEGIADLRVLARVEYRGVVAETTTGVDGTFTLRGLPDQETSVAAASTDDYLGTGAAARPPFPGSLELRLERASSLSGWVVDGSGDPVPDARVKISWWSENGSMSSGSRVSEEGFFEEKGWRPSSFVVAASAPGHGSGRYEGKIGTGEHLEIEVVLRPGVRLSGVVLDRGEAVADAEVFVGSPDGLSKNWRHVPPGMLSGLADLGTQVDGRGGFAFPSVEPTEVMLLVTAEGYETHRRKLDLRSGGADVTIELQRLAEIRGSVLDTFGQPVTGARVFGSTGSTHAETTTGSDGSFVLAVGELSRLRVHPLHDPILIHDDPATLLDGGTLRLILPEATATVSASIFGLDGSELARAQLYARGDVRDGWRSHASGTIQPEGNGVIRGLYPGTWTVFASSGELRRSRQADVTDGAANHVKLDFTDDIDLVLSLEIDGEAPSGTRVDIEPSDGPADRCHTDSFGRCLFSGLKPGSARLRLADWQSGLRHSMWLQVTGASEDRIALHTSRISGRVVPAGMVSVRLRQGDQTVETWSREDGTFQIRTAFVGEAELSIANDDVAASVQVALVPGADLSGVELVLEPEATTGETDGAHP